MHDLLRDLCLEKAKKENFLCVMRVGDIRQGIDTETCFVYNQGSISKPPDKYIVESAFLARSSASNGDSKFKLLRVLNAPGSDYGEDYTSKQVNLRYISIYKHSERLHSSISLLWNLQTLTIDWCRIVAPREIWEMPQLRHVNVTQTIWLPDPSPPLRRQQVVMRNLQTLERVLNLSEEVCKGIPNVKTLGVLYDDNFYLKGIDQPHMDFGRLHKLESLDCQFHWPPRRASLSRNLITFPSSLQELSLEGCYLHWEDLSMIGSLPHLRALALGYKSVIGSEWNPVEGEFLSLRSLKLSQVIDLISWNADKSHFPLLEELHLEGLMNLYEIPCGIGEIPTLGVIIVYKCSESSSISAVKIMDEQESYGNEGLGVGICLQPGEMLDRFKEKIEQFDRPTSKYLHLRISM